MSGIVVEHKRSGVRFAVSEGNFNPKNHNKVRDLKPGETVIGYQPRRKEEINTPRAKAADSFTPTDKPAGKPAPKQTTSK